MGRSKGKNSVDDRVMALAAFDEGAGEGALAEAAQATLPDHLKLQPEESQSDYLERIAPSFIEWLVGEAMFLKNQMAMGALTRLLEKKMDAQVKLEQITGRSGRMKQIVTGAPGDIRRAMGVKSLDKVMAGEMRASDIGREA